MAFWANIEVIKEIATPCNSRARVVEYVVRGNTYDRPLSALSGVTIAKSLESQSLSTYFSSSLRVSSFSPHTIDLSLPGFLSRRLTLP